MKFNSSNYILRREFFGGLLVCKENMSKYQINKYDYHFLYLTAKGYEVNESVQLIGKYYDITYMPDCLSFKKLGILIEGETPFVEVEEGYFLESDAKEGFNFLSAPQEISIYPSLRCNLNCGFCFLGNMLNARMMEADASKWLNKVEMLKSLGVSSVSVLGGEPILYYDIEKLLTGLESMGMRTSITSNGLLWDDKMIELVGYSKHITPIFSIQSFDDFNKRVMGRNHNLSVWKNTVSKLSTIKNIRINTVFLGQTDEQFHEIIDFCSENNVEKYSIAYYYKSNSSSQSITEILQLEKRLNEYLQVKKYALKISIEGCLLYTGIENFDGSVVQTEYQKLVYGCEVGNSILEILSNGNCYPCISFLDSEEFVIGNIFTENFIDFWENSNLLSRLRDAKTKDKSCLSCSCLSFCNGGCPRHNLYTYKNLESKGDSRCSIREKRGIR